MVEKHCALVYFSLRESKKNKKGLSPIEMSIKINTERVYYSTGKHVAVELWNKEKQLVRGKTEEAKLINDYLVNLRNKVFQKENELIEKGYLLTASLLRDAVLDKVDAVNEKTLLVFLSEFVESKKTMVGKTVAPATFYVFEHTYNLLRDFISEHYKRSDITLHEVNLMFIQSWHGYLLKRMGQNTCSKHLKFLKSLIGLAVANGFMQYNLIQPYKVEREPVEIDYLDDAELAKFINFDSPIPRLMKAKDMFLFGCFTGLSYIDIKTLDPSHLEKDSTGRLWIKKRRVKTGILSRIPVLPLAKMILDKYADKGELVPIQDASDVNKNIKDIATLCGINKHVTFHTSRHTFATTVTLSNNISLEVVSKMMGHTNTRMTTHYAKLIDKTIAEQMDSLVHAFMVPVDENGDD